eukprot:TRINITY_DN42382_c0_g1_i1.p2 TRINITY_DN42382_c0_g1~~TRINITY_DN42382_c0_g1_i1.p2  ORF type:complete len:351 (+),score=54.25 TRINITY_DN42382_c0_g1_i1:69-1055(+)
MLAALCVAAAAHAPAAAPGLNCSLLRGVEPPAAAPAFRGEFGWEMVWAGNMFFLWACNRLRLTRSCGPLRALYFFSPHHTSVRCSRGAALPNARQTPWRAGCERWLSAPGCQSWLPVPLQMYWERRPLRWPDAATRALPLVVLFNKKYREWGSEAVNFIDEQTLNATLAVLVAGRHRVAYRRMTQAPRELRTDWHAQESSMDDARIVASHPREMVRRLDELAAGTDFNEALGGRPVDEGPCRCGCWPKRAAWSPCRGGASTSLPPSGATTSFSTARGPRTWPTTRASAGRTGGPRTRWWPTAPRWCAPCPPRCAPRAAARPSSRRGAR